MGRGTPSGDISRQPNRETKEIYAIYGRGEHKEYSSPRPYGGHSSDIERGNEIINAGVGGGGWWDLPEGPVDKGSGLQENFHHSSPRAVWNCNRKRTIGNMEGYDPGGEMISRGTMMKPTTNPKVVKGLVPQPYSHQSIHRWFVSPRHTPSTHSEGALSQIKKGGLKLEDICMRFL